MVSMAHNIARITPGSQPLWSWDIRGPSGLTPMHFAAIRLADNPLLLSHIPEFQQGIFRNISIHCALKVLQPRHEIFTFKDALCTANAAAVHLCGQLFVTLQMKMNRRNMVLCDCCRLNTDRLMFCDVELWSLFHTVKADDGVTPVQFLELQRLPKLNDHPIELQTVRMKHAAEVSFSKCIIFFKLRP